MHANGSDSVYDFRHANIFLSVRMYVSMQRTSDKVGLKVCGYSDSSTRRPSSWHYTHTEIIHPTYSKLLQHTIQDLSRTFLGQLCTFWKTLQYTANLHAAKFKKSQLSFEAINENTQQCHRNSQYGEKFKWIALHYRIKIFPNEQTIFQDFQGPRSFPRTFNALNLQLLNWSTSTFKDVRVPWHTT